MNPHFEQLKQLMTITWDGNIIDKQTRDELINRGLAQRKEGWTWLTDKGVDYLITLHVLVP